MRRTESQRNNLKLIAQQLGALRSGFVFTGGAVVGLLLTDSIAPDVRPTDDVDVIIAIARYSDYAQLQEELRKIGFKNTIDGPICRFTFHGLIVDIMPSEPDILGFSNRWYNYAIASAVESKLPDGTVIRHVSAPAFIATKLDAFTGRGKGDYALSHDIEDIIALLDGRPEITTEIANAHPEVQNYIAKSFADFIKDQDFLDSLAMHLYPDAGSQARSKIILDRIRTIADLPL